MDRFWQFVNVSETEGELILYGPIASKKPWWSDDGSDGIYANQFTKDLKALGNISHLKMRINSGGGDVFAANAIFAQVKSHAAKVTAIIEGVAASAATILLAAADTVQAYSNATVMVHDPLAGMMGYYNKKDLEKVGNVLDTVKASIVAGYVSKTGRTAEELSALMDEETWMTAEEAKTEGFVDEILDLKVEATMTMDNRFMVVNSVLHDLAGFETRPTIRGPLAPMGAFATPNRAPTPQPIARTNQEPAPQEKGDDEVKDLADLQAKHPEIYQAAVNAGAEQERNRIKGIDEIANTISDELVAKAKYTEPVNASDLALQALKADAGKGLKHLDAREEELDPANQVKPGELTAEQQQAAAAEAASIELIAAAANNRRGRMEAK